MNPDLVITVEGVSFFGRTPPGGSGLVVSPKGLSGIDGGVAAKGQTVSRPYADGDFDLPTFLDSRIVSLSGTALTDSPVKMRWLADAFAGLLIGRAGAITVDHLGATRSGRVRLAPGVKSVFDVDAADPTSADFQIQFKMADPLFYGDTRVTASGQPALNYGNTVSAPVHVISGAAPGYSLTAQGRTIQVTQAVTAGNPHTIDSRTGLLTIGGVAVFGKMPVQDFWGVPGGGSVIQTLTPVSGSLSLASYTPDAFA